MSENKTSNQFTPISQLPKTIALTSKLSLSSRNSNKTQNHFGTSYKQFTKHLSIVSKDTDYQSPPPKIKIVSPSTKRKSHIILKPSHHSRTRNKHLNNKIHQQQHNKDINNGEGDLLLLPQINNSPHVFFQTENVLEVSFGQDSPKKTFYKMKTYGIKTHKRLKITSSNNNNPKIIKLGSHRHQNSNCNISNSHKNLFSDQVTPKQKQSFSINTQPKSEKTPKFKTYFKHNNIITGHNKYHHSIIIKHNDMNVNTNNNTNINSNVPIQNLYLHYKKYPSPKVSSCSINNNLKSFAVNSYQGIKRNYNEDKVSIILSISKPKGFEGVWPQCSFFAIYDGHGGNKCCDFLRDNLHNFIIKNKHFPSNPEKALIQGFEEADNYFLTNISIPENNKSGSCALVILCINTDIYIANCGDSRAIASFNFGTRTNAITIDHKPNNPKELERIKSNGGSIYLSIPQSTSLDNDNGSFHKGTYRINPGHLSVSRSFGDVDVKNEAFGGIKGILIATPEVFKINIIKDSIDYMLIGCDGIFNRINDEEIFTWIWEILNEDIGKTVNSIHSLSSTAVDLVIKTALKRGSKDNVTALFIAFNNYQKKFDDVVKQLKRSDGLLVLKSQET